MSEENGNIKRELEEYRVEYGFIKEEYCTYEENQKYEEILKNGGTLPEGVKPTCYEDGTRSGMYYTVHEEKLTDAERLEYLSYKKLSILKSIRSLVIGILLIAIVSFFIIISMSGKVSSIYDDIEQVSDEVKEFYNSVRSFFGYRY
ncbi:MAG: hypothetical protein IKV16_04580 [Clostridia bacterium]|nr:hypothetical protein [Clostridia bacterium]